LQGVYTFDIGRCAFGRVFNIDTGEWNCIAFLIGYLTADTRLLRKCTKKKAANNKA
jgi:hypothetical protein